jgi:protein-glucosylgalactosylhydroxylysine glucosidase
MRFTPPTCLAGLLSACLFASATDAAEPIDRRALVSRHNVVHRSAAPEHFLQVGNGEFAYAFDVTGMQTLDRTFEHPIPLHTMSNWGWHSFPNEGGFTYDRTLSEYDADGRKVTYADRQNTPAGEYFRANPHRMNLARIGLWWEGQGENGATAEDLDDFTEIEQMLDLWTGCATSKFKFRGEPVTVMTVAHPWRDVVTFRIESPLLNRGALGIVVRYSYPLGAWGPAVDDLSKPELHHSDAQDDIFYHVARSVDDRHYYVTIDHGGGGVYRSPHGPHATRYQWGESESEEQAFGTGGQAFDDIGELTFEFSDGAIRPEEEPIDFDDVLAAAARKWQDFWQFGGAIDLGGTDDPRASELERRIVLSQYLTAIQNGSLPPAETGLLCNSWFGKQHLEMHWWHAAHFALWGRPEILEKSLAWYAKILPQAQAIAQRQGYAGARWPKMCGPDGVSSPSGVGEFLIWQQPHIIALAELVYRAKPTPETLERYAPLIDETARFMADFVEWDDDGEHCHLGPPLIPAQENYRPRDTRDPSYELAYWHWALSTAQAWRERQGQPREAEWARVIAGLPKPLVRDGRYAAVAVEPFTNTADHPSMLCAYGVLPRTPLVESETMLATAKWVEEPGVWDWESTWGWDFPVISMTYARCGEPEAAVDALLRDTPKNKYLPNGHNYQEERLPAYLPGNGGVLAAAAMMAAGWDDGPERSAPGFPAEWNVRFEGLTPMP